MEEEVEEEEGALPVQPSKSQQWLIFAFVPKFANSLHITIWTSIKLTQLFLKHTKCKLRRHQVFTYWMSLCARWRLTFTELVTVPSEVIGPALHHLKRLSKTPTGPSVVSTRCLHCERTSRLRGGQPAEDTSGTSFPLNPRHDTYNTYPK